MPAIHSTFLQLFFSFFTLNTANTFPLSHQSNPFKSSPSGWVNMLKRNNKFENKVLFNFKYYWLFKKLKSLVNILLLIFTYGFHLKKLLTYELELPHSFEKRLHLLNLYDGYAPKLKKNTRRVDSKVHR